jgi:hypothetical protein
VPAGFAGSTLMPQTGSMAFMRRFSGFQSWEGQARLRDYPALYR